MIMIIGCDFDKGDFHIIFVDLTRFSTGTTFFSLFLLEWGSQVILGELDQFCLRKGGVVGDDLCRGGSIF